MIPERAGHYGVVLGRMQRVHPLRSTAVQPEHDRLGRRAPNMRSPMHHAVRAIQRVIQEEAASQVFRIR